MDINDKIFEIVKICKEINFGTVEYNQQIMDLYIVRECAASKFGLYAEISYMEGRGLWQYRIIDLESKLVKTWSSEMYNNSDDALLDGILNLFEIIRDEKRYTPQFDDCIVQDVTGETDNN